MKKEIWLWAKGYKGYYRISTKGRVRSVSRFVKCRSGALRKLSGRIRLPGPAGNGYLGVSLSKKGKIKTELLHRLVAVAFVPNPNNLPEVNHKDTNKKNCAADNLEWVSQKGNSEHAVEYNLVAFGTRIKNAKLDDSKARKIFLSSGIQRKIAADHNVSVMTVSLIKRKKIWRRATEGLSCSAHM